MLGFVVTGFAQSYFLAGMLAAKLPNVLVAIHGALFVSWILLLVLQNTLVAARRVKLHMTLGTLGTIVPVSLVVFGVLTLIDSIRRTGTPVPPPFLLTGDLEEIAVFAALTCAGLVLRRRAASHKRLMMLGTMAMLGPAIDRWPVSLGMPGEVGVYLALPLLIVAYDLVSQRRVLRSTAIGVGIIAAGIVAVFPIAQTQLVQQCLTWIGHV